MLFDEDKKFFNPKRRMVIYITKELNMTKKEFKRRIKNISKNKEFRLLLSEKLEEVGVKLDDII